jgi:hypothetical protein
MKQTAVEWLLEQLECFGNKHELQMSWATVDELLKQAKEIERQQIVDFGYDIAEDLAWGKYRDKKAMEERYNEYLTYREEDETDSI